MLPSIKYQAHIYSSSADKRWIKLNGRELHEGESIGALMVKEITPEQSVIDFDGYEFSLKSPARLARVTKSISSMSNIELILTI